MSVSVVITTKNREKFLLRALKSVLAQTVPVDQVIIVDDGSSNAEYLDELESDKVKIIKNKQSYGGAKARNIGASFAKSEVLMFLDDDDCWENFKVEKQMPLFSDFGISLVFSGKRVVYDVDLNKEVRKIVPLKKEVDQKNVFERNYIGTTSSVATRLVDFNKVGGFDERLKCLQDYDLWIRLCQLGKAVYDGSISVTYTEFIENGKQVSKLSDGRHAETANILLDKYSGVVPPAMANKFSSNLYYSVSKANVGCNSSVALKFIIKSLFARPSIRGVGLLIKSTFNV